MMLISLFWSCSPINKNECQMLDESEYTLVKKNETVTFNLDSLSSPNIRYSEFFTADDQLFFTFLNPHNNTVYYYDYSSKELVKKVALESDRKLSGYSILGFSRIISYEYWNEMLVLHDSSGAPLKMLKVPSVEDSYYAFPSNRSPVKYSDGAVYLAGGNLTLAKIAGNAHPVARIDTNLQKFEYTYSFPDIYENTFFGGNHYNMDISYDYNPKLKSFVFSFPASHSIEVTSDMVNKKIYCAGSRYIDQIPPFDKTDIDDSFEFSTENGFYYRIMYDQYRDVYYRFCLHPSNLVEGINRYTRDLSIVILNNSFEIVGEKFMKNGEDFKMNGLSSMAIAPEGLLIRKDLGVTNEDQLIFEIYELKLNQ